MLYAGKEVYKSHAQILSIQRRKKKLWKFSAIVNVLYCFSITCFIHFILIVTATGQSDDARLPTQKKHHQVKFRTVMKMIKITFIQLPGHWFNIQLEFRWFIQMLTLFFLFRITRRSSYNGVYGLLRVIAFILKKFNDKQQQKPLLLMEILQSPSFNCEMFLSLQTPLSIKTRWRTSTQIIINWLLSD